MAAYIDYTFYSDTYHGSLIPVADFDPLALAASAVIDQVTFDRASQVIAADTDTDLIEKIKLATCAVADEVYRQNEVGISGRISSERVGQYSVTYVNDLSRSNSDTERLSRKAKLFLGNTGLMYKGFLNGEYGSIPNADEL